MLAGTVTDLAGADAEGSRACDAPVRTGLGDEPAGAGQGRAWMFVRLKSQGREPRSTPSPVSQFRSAMGDSIVRWEEHATFSIRRPW